MGSPANHWRLREELRPLLRHDQVLFEARGADPGVRQEALRCHYHAGPQGLIVAQTPVSIRLAGADRNEIGNEIGCQAVSEQGHFELRMIEVAVLARQLTAENS